MCKEALTERFLFERYSVLEVAPAAKNKVQEVNRQGAILGGSPLTSGLTPAPV
ncbi:hypothetical protein [Trinickia soli]|uniref:hypothetical protein n=1 Tax=Trinickia soli TaxID=380675 RepID=UPI001304CC49|nr:hypothetical protein [Trinickia soli]CAB3730133.1 hypothetical protein LMG24076_05390 [Trinickia soli]